MKFNFSEKVVVVSGASSGIGAEIAVQLANKGAIVVLASRNTDNLEVVCDKCRINSPDSVYITTDVSSESECKSMIDQTIELFGRIDVLISNAGVSMRAMVNDCDTDVLKKVMDTNFWGAVYLTKYALPHLLKSKGMIVAISSISGIKALPGRSAYTASKFALNGYMETLKIENLYTGIHVMVALPGFTATNIRKSALNGHGVNQEESPRNEKKLMPSSKAAANIIKGMEQKKDMVILTGVGKALFWLNKFFPGFVNRKVYEDFEKEPGSPLKGLR